MFEAIGHVLIDSARYHYHYGIVNLTVMIAVSHALGKISHFFDGSILMSVFC
jgi:hypothetical protein